MPFVRLLTLGVLGLSILLSPTTGPGRWCSPPRTDGTAIAYPRLFEVRDADEAGPCSTSVAGDSRHYADQSHQPPTMHVVLSFPLDGLPKVWFGAAETPLVRASMATPDHPPQSSASHA